MNDFAHIEIPGIELEEEIGRGGMARVFLATQTKFARQVAVKFVSPAYTDDSQFRQRFLAESRINAQLTHPHIVQVYDFGALDEGLYLVMEYLPGGDLTARAKRGLEFRTLINIIKEICDALDYAHGKDIIHRDIKPENILFRDNGSAVLTDFGIARFVSQEINTVTRHGTVVGTPQYMSPEQAAGRVLDGRSDLYSLGVVLYRMLTGDVPFNATSAVAIGIKHLQDPVPRLPNYLASFQSLIDTVLAKKPEQRYQTGRELSQALDTITTNGTLPELTIKTQVITTQEILAVGSDLLSTQRDPGRAERGASRRRSRRPLRKAFAAALVFTGLGAGVFYAVDSGYVTVDEITQSITQTLGIGDDPALATAWSEAQSLRQDPNQGLAAIVAAYRRVLALDDTHAGAIAAVEDLAKDWKNTINSALAEGKVELAATRLNEAVAAFPQDTDLTDFSIRLQNRQRADRLFQSTSALLASHGLSDIPSATSAILTYQDVLRLSPGHEGATSALLELAQHYARLSREAVASGDVNTAMNLLERATAAAPDIDELENVRLMIGQATESQAAIDAMLQRARRYRADKQLVAPPGENAAELYHRVLATDPNNAVATQGLDEVTGQVLADANKLLAEGLVDFAQNLANQAAKAGLSATAVNDIRRRIDEERSRLDAVAIAIRDATEYMDQGFLTTPADANAVTRLRDLLKLDPGNALATELLEACANRLAGVAREAHEFGLHNEAKQYLDLALAITPDVDTWIALRESWEGES